MAKVIILNGPPGCGKDTLADLINDHCFVNDVHSFKEPMFDIAKIVLGCRYGEFIKLYNSRETKEKPVSWLNGRSPRQFLIFISEDFVKPAVSEFQFGVLAAENIHMNEDVVMSDGGFPSEVQALAEYHRNGKKHVIHVVRLHRDGYTFEGDSRNYIDLGDSYKNVIHHDIRLVDGQAMLAVGQIVEACNLNDV